jgi:hypothetical protein
MTSTQAKLVGGALATIVGFCWAASLPEPSPWRPSIEVGSALAVLFVALVDMTLGGKAEHDPPQPEAPPPQQGA